MLQPSDLRCDRRSTSPECQISAQRATRSTGSGPTARRPPARTSYQAPGARDRFGPRVNLTRTTRRRQGVRRSRAFGLSRPSIARLPPGDSPDRGPGQRLRGGCPLPLDRLASYARATGARFEPSRRGDRCEHGSRPASQRGGDSVLSPAECSALRSSRDSPRLLRAPSATHVSQQ